MEWEDDVYPQVMVKCKPTYFSRRDGVWEILIWILGKTTSIERKILNIYFLQKKFNKKITKRYRENAVKQKMKEDV